MGGLVDAVFGGSDPAPPPDYTPVAQASKEAAEISAQLGREQLTEARRQYDQNMAVAQPVVNAQLEVMRQGIEQGNDYNAYLKEFRPLERQMLGQVSDTSAKDAAEQAQIDAITGEAKANAQTLQDRTAAYENEARTDIALATGGNRGIADKFAADIDYDVGRAVADARVGQTQALNTAARQAARYGISLPSALQPQTNQNAAQLAAAANNTRDGAINRYRDIVAGGIGMKQGVFQTGQAATMDAMSRSEAAGRAGRDMQVQNESLDWAKKLDVTGLVRGMPGASQGSYGVAVSAGNSATQNQMAPGNALVGAMGQSNATQMQGRQIAMNGLTSVLGAQGQYNGQVNAANTARQGQMLDMIGTGLGVAFSDIRLKRDIVKVGEDPRGFGWYEFSYKGGDGARHIGVMAQEVEQILPGAVTEISGAKAVYYHLL